MGLVVKGRINRIGQAQASAWAWIRAGGITWEIAHSAFSNGSLPGASRRQQSTHGERHLRDPLVCHGPTAEAPITIPRSASILPKHDPFLGLEPAALSSSDIHGGAHHRAPVLACLLRCDPDLRPRLWKLQSPQPSHHRGRAGRTSRRESYDPLIPHRSRYRRFAL